MLAFRRVKDLFVKRKTCVTAPLPEACSLDVEMSMPEALAEDLPRVARLVAEKAKSGELDAANAAEIVGAFKIIAAKCRRQCELGLLEACEKDSVRRAASEYERVLDEALEAAVGVLENR